MINDVYQALANFIFDATGIVYKPGDYYRLEARVSEIVKEFSLENPNDILTLLGNKLTAKEKSNVIDIATNNETYFFRDNKPFDTLVNNLLDEFSERLPLKLWSTGCSTGQEVYSILMKICEKKDETFLKSVSIDATDISTHALERAKIGQYDGIEIQRGLPVKFLTTFFSSLDSGAWKFKDQYKQGLRFFPFNLLKDDYKSETYHIVFCRNVLIYQSRENKESILNNIFKSLKPGGYLLLGSGESLIGFDLPFIQKKIGLMIVFQKPLK